MSNYRNDMREITKDSYWTFWKVGPLAVLVIGALAALGFVLNSAGIIGRTVVEREVFEKSYQRSESLKARIATDEAALAEIARKLNSPNLDPNTRANLEAQASAIRIRLDTARRLQ